MAEEFHESDIIFSDHHHHHRRRLVHSSLDHSQILVTPHRNSKNNHKHSAASSLPIKIPETVIRLTSDMGELDEEWDSDDNIVPPHMIIRRRLAGKMAFSVCTGDGRTLKGRDLSHVRNSILRMTGFLETN